MVSVEADHLVISGYGNTGITSDARALQKDGANRGATSPAGSVTVTANTLELHDFGKISSNTDTVGKAGSVTIRADRLLILGSGGERAEEREYTGITTNARTGSTGAAGDVTVQTGELELRKGGVISSNTLGPGQAGTVSIRAGNLIISSETDGTKIFTGISSVTGGSGNAGVINVRAGNLSASGEPSTPNVVTAGIVTDALATSSGDAGEIVVDADKLTLRGAGVIRSATWASGDAGTVSVRSDELLVSGGAFFATGIMSDADFSSSTGVAATGKAGRVVVEARELSISDGGVIRSDTWGPGNAGPVSVRADHLLISDLNNTGITSDARRTNASDPFWSF